MARVASIGECMIELSEHDDGRITRSFGGDTLNTSVYLARLGVDVDYVTALGDDAWSDEMVRAWRAEGVGCGQVQRVPGRLPGLYFIQTDGGGERRFSYWRDRAPAREIFTSPATGALADALTGYSHIYFSGISLSLYDDAGRAALFQALDAAEDAGVAIVFDTNYRARGWRSADSARAAFALAMQRARMIFASVEDLEPLFGADPQRALEGFAAAGADVVLKLREPGCRLISAGGVVDVLAAPVAGVVDTTAAGDSFAAAYLAARLRGLSAEAAARAGHRLAGVVVQYRGAIIPRAAMPAALFA